MAFAQTVLDDGARSGVSTKPAVTLSATELALAKLTPWWRHQVRKSGLDPAWEDLAFALQAKQPAPIPELPDGVPFDAAGTDGLAIGQAYVATVDPAIRSEHGRHYTPLVLAEQLWKMTRSALGFGETPEVVPGLVRDPACGAGALLVPVLREYLRARSDVDPSIVLAALPQAVEGIDTDPWAVYVANVVLAAEMLPTLARAASSLRPLPALAHVGDGLAADLEPAQVCIMNPPYGRRKMTDSERARLGGTVYGHANMYGLFLAAAAKMVGADGVVSALVPTSFTAGLYFSRLRSYLAEKIPLHEIAFVKNRSRVFRDVQQETCLAVFRAGSPAVRVHSISDEVAEIASVPTPTGDRPWLLPRREQDAPLVAAASFLPNTLRSAGWHASTGPLVWNRRRADLHSNASKGRAYVLWAADIDGGRVHRDVGRDHIRYLSLHGEKDRAVNALTQPAILVQRTTAPEQVRRLVVAPLDADLIATLGGAVVVENHINVLRPTSDEPLLTQRLLTRLLSSQMLDDLLRCISGSTAVSSYELGSLPLPSASELDRLAAVADDDFEAELARAYGLPLAF
ncbi:Eco57I restriction-modification methylase domain-containing protein [Curtobacterium sp. MCPF17_031]|uniref:Eco57I restriction-modification methylase domain-containing protein n=1 Tax=Curtobacterium sp. MCPF17_031 TaxID=2175653 RepID=UPI000DA73F99|nr:Eco57I restriction-modification methylase domain-containing protein [Curtobacterium sp. MCPF17_031]PZE34249.1 hypothetical protein DEJ31_15250 [Curtobacterium sp. MCPF17_031]